MAEHLFLALHSTVTEHRKDNHKVEGTLNNHDDQTGNYWAEGKCSTTSLFFNDQVVNYYKHTGWLYKIIFLADLSMSKQAMKAIANKMLCNVAHTFLFYYKKNSTGLSKLKQANETK